MISTNQSPSIAAKADSYTKWLHDLNNVLAAIRLQTILGRVHAEGVSDELMQVLKAIEKSCEQATCLLEKFSKELMEPVSHPGRLNPGMPTNDLSSGEKNGCVLLMDDNEAVRSSLFKILSGFGYEVYVAGSGLECIEQFKELQRAGKRVDVALLDLRLPGGIGGVETLAKLHELDPEVKAVASTGFSEGDVVTNFRQYGFQGVLHKPFHIQELIVLLDHLIQPLSCL